MQLTTFISLLKNRRFQIWSGVVVGLSLVAGGLWLSPFRTPIVHQVKLVLGMSTPPPDFYTAPSTSPTVDSLAPLTEKMHDLEGQVLALEQARAGDQQLVDGLKNEYQNVVSEVAKTNDLLEAQLTELKKTLANVKVTTTSTTQTGEAKSTSDVQTSGKLNINTATVAQLDGLPGIGPAYAQRIVDYRNEHGPFKSVNDLDKVSGIGPATIEKIRDLVQV